MILGFIISKTEDMRLKVRHHDKDGENGYCRDYFCKQSFCHTFPVHVIPKAQNYRECMESKQAIFRNFKERIPSPVHLSCELELTCLVYEDESLKSRVMYSLFCL